MYEESLYTILKDYITPATLNKYNKNKKWEYGYNEQHDMVVISKDGTIGEIYEIQNLKIALPKQNNVHKFNNNKWRKVEYPKVLSTIKKVYDFNKYIQDYKERG